MVRRTAKPAEGERLLEVSTKCRSVDELVARFAPFATDDSLTVPARPGTMVGERVVLRVTLADETEVFSARGEVIEVKEAGHSSVDSRPVVRVKLREMDEGSHSLFLALCSRILPRHPPLARSSDSERTVVPSGKDPPLNDLLATRPRLSVPTKPPPLPVVPVVRQTRSAVPTAPSGAPAREMTRAAGSLYKLPANPLADLNADAVTSFVECNVYEASPEAPPKDDEVTKVGEAPLGMMASLDDVTATSAVEGGGRGQVQAVWRGIEELFQRLPAPFRRTLAQAVPFAFCTLLGWCVGFNMAGLEPARSLVATPAVPDVPAKQVVPAAKEAVPPVAAPPGSPPPPVAPVANVTPVPGDAPSDAAGCRVRIDVKPADVLVKWDGRVLGRTPLREASVACGPARLVLVRDRWETVDRQVVASPEAPLDLSIRMNRPTAALQVLTTPPGATIEVNGVAVGKSPRQVTLRRYETVKVGLRLPGHRLWRKNMLIRSGSDKLSVQLDALSASAGADTSGVP